MECTLRKYFSLFLALLVLLAINSCSKGGETAGTATDVTNGKVSGIINSTGNHGELDVYLIPTSTAAKSMGVADTLFLTPEDKAFQFGDVTPGTYIIEIYESEIKVGSHPEFSLDADKEVVVQINVQVIIIQNFYIQLPEGTDLLSISLWDDANGTAEYDSSQGLVTLRFTDSNLTTMPLEFELEDTSGTVKALEYTITKDDTELIIPETQDEDPLIVEEPAPLAFGADTVNGTFLDPRDSTLYPIVRINKTWWFAANLAYLPLVADYATNIGNSQYAPTNSENITNGYYYHYSNSFHPDSAYNPCPEGTRVTNASDWNQLEYHLGISLADIASGDWHGIEEGNFLKAGPEWLSGRGADTVGFNAYPSGLFEVDGIFKEYGMSTGFWYYAEIEGDYAAVFKLRDADGKIYRGTEHRTKGYSIRCVLN